jgi:hypothetical protein
MRKEPCFDTDLADFEGEVWKDVKGFDGLYSISNLGRVRAEARWVRVGGGGERLKKACIMRQQVKIKHGIYDGLMQVMFSVGGQVYAQKVHQLVGRAFCRPLKDGEMYYRKDFNTKNNRANNIGISTADKFMDIAKYRHGQTENYSDKIPKSAIELAKKTGISVKAIVKHKLTSEA